MKRFSLLGTVLAGLFFIALPAFAADVVKLGVNEIRSGAFKINGDRLLSGIAAAVKEANDTGGILGKKLELVIEDNQMKGEIAVEKLKKMILNDDCQAILQGCSSGVGGAIAQTMPRYKRIYLNVAAEAMGITGADFTPFAFRTCPNAGMHVKGLAQYFGSKGFKKVFFLNQDYSFGHDVAEYYEKFIKKIAPDTQIVGTEYHKFNNKDFAPYISKIQASGADYVISGNWGVDLTQLIVQGRSLGMKPPVGCLFLDEPTVMSVARDAATGCIQAGMYILGAETPRANEFEDAFHKSSGGSWPCHMAMHGYIGTKMYLAAVKKAGTFETFGVIKAFEGFQWEGPLGTMTMRKEDHQNQMPIAIGGNIGKTKYFDFPYIKSMAVIPGEKVSLTLEESGWKPWSGK